MGDQLTGVENKAGRLRASSLLSPDGPWLPLLCVGVFSLLYFAATAIRASEKPFWFDELCSLYIVRLPTFADSWRAVLHGADFNPPLFYLIQRADRALFGDGLIAARLPAMVSFWILCLCLFRFAYKLAGWRAGWVAMVLPVLTGAYYYAYEARPHGIVLGFCGLALVAWQESERKLPRRGLWLLALSLFLAAAFFTHCYALVIVVPFGLVELVRNVRTRSIQPATWIALLAPVAVAVIAFIPLLRSYRTTMGGVGMGWHNISTVSLGRIPIFYSDLLSPCILIVLCALLFLCVERLSRPADLSEPANETKITVSTALLIGAFSAMPIYGNILARLLKGPFFARYFMTAVAGVCLIIALSMARKRWSRASAVLSLLVGCTLVTDTCLVVWHRLTHHAETLVEPSTGWMIDTEIGDRLATRRWMIAQTGTSLPIVIASQMDFLYLVHYWPEAKPRLYTVSTSTRELAYRLYTAVGQYCHVGYNSPETYDQFLPAHKDFFVFGDANTTPVLAYLTKRGATFEDLRFQDFGTFLAKVHVDEPPKP